MEFKFLLVGQSIQNIYLIGLVVITLLHLYVQPLIFISIRLSRK